MFLQSMHLKQILIVSLFTRNPELADVIADPDTYLMYPGPGARELRDLARERGPDAGPCRLLLLDGTWQQAKGLYAKNKFLHSLKQVSSDISNKFLLVQIGQFKHKKN